MIQRKQTLYLLLVVILTTVMVFGRIFSIEVFTDSATTTTELAGQNFSQQAISADRQIETIRLTALGGYSNKEQIFSTPYLATLLILTSVLALVTIFLYRKRWIQIRLCMAIAIMELGVAMFFGFYIYSLQSVVGTEDLVAVKYSLLAFFPLISIIAIYFAYRGVAHDIALLKSADRIR